MRWNAIIVSNADVNVWAIHDMNVGEVSFIFLKIDYGVIEELDATGTDNAAGFRPCFVKAGLFKCGRWYLFTLNTRLHTLKVGLGPEICRKALKELEGFYFTS